MAIKRAALAIAICIILSGGGLYLYHRLQSIPVETGLSVDTAYFLPYDAIYEKKDIGDYDFYQEQYTYKAEVKETEPRNVVPTALNLQVNERSLEFAAKIIDNASYLRLVDLNKAFYESILDYALEEFIYYWQIDGYFVNGYEYFSIRQIADLLGFRLAWVNTRNTIIVDTNKFYNGTPTEPIFKMEPLPEHIVQFITDVSFHENRHFDHSFLTYLTITHVGFDGKYHLGNMIVAAEIGEEVLDIFREILYYRFPIERMRIIDFYGASDYLSMADNNSAAFNFRYIAGTTRLSRHAFGMAIDINPIQNPYIRGSTVWPYSGQAYVDRTNVRPGMIVRGCPVYRAFTSRGWTWGGTWSVPRDYHHFERRT